MKQNFGHESWSNLVTPSATNLEVVFFRDAKMDDGRYANNGWMQELPDPITKMVWDNAVLVSRKTASELGVQNGDLVEITLNGRSVTGPIWVQPGMADYSLGLALGYGRERAGRIGTRRRFQRLQNFQRQIHRDWRDDSQDRPDACAGLHAESLVHGRPAGGARGKSGRIPKEAEFCAGRCTRKSRRWSRRCIPNPLDQAEKKALHQWGLVVDLTACVGCATCVVACQSENNIPIVGKDQVLRGREMHWMRIDRYYTADPAKETEADSIAQGQRATVRAVD